MQYKHYPICPLHSAAGHKSDNLNQQITDKRPRIFVDILRAIALCLLMLLWFLLLEPMFLLVFA